MFKPRFPRPLVLFRKHQLRYHPWPILRVAFATAGNNHGTNGRVDASSRLVNAVASTAGAAVTLSLLFYLGVQAGKRNKIQNFSQPREESCRMHSTLPLGKTPALQHDLSPQNLQHARAEFVAIVGDDGVDDTKGNLLAHSSTEWSPAPDGACPALIVCPRSTEEVSQLVKICHRRRLPMTGFCGGTSLDGALAATHGGICIDFKRMNRVQVLHKSDMDVVVQPAVGWEHLNDFLAKENLFFPPDPGPGAQIGGMVATGCSGTNAYRYGTMKDWVVSMTVVLADGTIIKTRNRPRKSSAGYDLTRLFVGSGGTLGLVTEAVLKVTAKPENVQVAVVAFPSTQKAVDTAVGVVGKGLQVAAMELLDALTMKAVNESGYSTREWKETPTLFFKFSGTPRTVQEQIDHVKTLARENSSLSFESSKDPEQISALWSARKTALWSLLAMKRNPDDTFTGTDVAVPISRLGDIIEETRAKIEVSGLLGSTLGHVGDGNFHASILHSASEHRAASQIIDQIRTRGIEMEGTVTGEHGIGLTLRDTLVMELGEGAVDAMRAIKMALDPLCLLNCGKIVRMEPVGQNGKE